MQSGRPRLWLLLLAVLAFSTISGISLASLHFGRTTAQPPAPLVPQAGDSATPLPAAPAPDPTLSPAAPPALTAPAGPDPLRPLPQGAGKLAIIIDDVGQGLPGTTELLAIARPLTFSFIPHTPHFEAERREVTAAGQQVFLHVPMEPLPSSFSGPIPDAITTAMTADQIVAQLRELAATLPEARGANNHMGSKVTADQRVMTTVMETLKALHLPFVDSRTQSQSVAYATAQRVGLASGANSLFIDKDKPVLEAGTNSTPAAVRAVEERLRQAATIAQSSGSVIVIAHPRPAVAEALAAMVPVLEQAGIKLVYASELLH
ncbi:MAG: divergent polysaccharide deacetylase family protein [Symbiobacteriia bacterium]